MKLFSILPIAFAALALLTPSCNKKDVNPIDAGSGEVTATVDGAAWKSKSGADGAVYAESMGTNIIQAYHEDGSYIGLTIFGSPSSGSSFVTDAGLFQAQYKPDFEGTEVYATFASTTPGTISFTTVNSKTMKGAFSFTGRMFDSMGNPTDIEVKNGEFEFNF